MTVASYGGTALQNLFSQTFASLEMPSSELGAPLHPPFSAFVCMSLATGAILIIPS